MAGELGAQDGLVATYERLVMAKDASRDRIIAHGMRLGQLHEELAAVSDAERTYRTVQRIDPGSRVARDALARLYRDGERWAEYVELEARALDDERGELDDDERIERTLDLASRLVSELERDTEAIDRLARLARDFPGRPRIHDALIELLVARGFWHKAVDELRTAAQEVDDEDYRVAALRRIARIYGEELDVPVRAAEAWGQVREARPDDQDALVELTRLHSAAGAHAKLIPILDARLDTLAADERERVPLLEAKARALHEVDAGADAALDTVGEALALVPGNAELIALRITIARAASDPSHLVASLSDASEPDGWLEAAEVADRRVGDEGTARSLYGRVLELAMGDDAPLDASRLSLAAVDGLVGIAIRDRNGAAEDLAELAGTLVAGPARARVLVELGRSSADRTEARRHFAAAVDDDPEFAVAKLELASVLFEAGELAGAEPLVEEAVAALPRERGGNHDRAIVLYARILERTDREGEANTRLSAALRSAPESLPIRTALVRNHVAAGRHKRALEVALPAVKAMDAGTELEPGSVAAELLAMVARCEAELGRDEDALAHVRRALALDPESPAVRSAAMDLARASGAYADAASHARAMAETAASGPERARHLLAAGIAGWAARDEDLEGDSGQTALGLLHQALAELDGFGCEAADVTELVQVFACAEEGADTALALAVIDGLLDRDELAAERKHDLVLAGAGLALAHGDAADLERVSSLVARARMLVPGSSEAVVTQADVLERMGRSEAIGPLIWSFLSERRQQQVDDPAADARLRVQMARYQTANPEQAIASLEWAGAVDPSVLTAEVCTQLAELYERAGVSGPQVLHNHVALLSQSPLHEPSLRAVADNATADDPDRAWALYRVLATLVPDDEGAREFFAAHELAPNRGSEGAPSTSIIGDLVPADVPDAGVSEALERLWDVAWATLTGGLKAVDVPQETLVSAMGGAPLSATWREVLRVLGPSKTILMDGSMRPEFAATYCEVRCQHPPVIVAGARARASRDARTLRFALARALYCARPDAMFATCVDRSVLASILSAVLAVFHPRHEVRRQRTQGEPEAVRRLVQELTRKVPRSVGRALGNLFEAHADETFDSGVWRRSHVRRANRLGLVVSGEPSAAVRVLAGEDDVCGDALRERLAADTDLRELFGYAISDEYVAARKRLGFGVRRV
jgi:tetratricopeptide (TPR) repeat protein